MSRYFLFLLSIVLLNACIKDDFVMDEVDPVLRITSTVDTIGLNQEFQFEYMYLNNVGLEEEIIPQWSSSNEQIISIDANGLAQALAIGTSTITVQYELDSIDLVAEMEVVVGQRTVMMDIVKSGMIRTTSSYRLSGDFTLRANGDDLELEFDDNYTASTSLPGLYIYLTNNANTTNGALEIGAVEVFNGSHSYTIPNTNINEYAFVLYFCKPFNVKVGDGRIE